MATDLPSGTLTFLFTDIEGSTRLWEQHPQAMVLAHARHDEIVSGAVEAHGGTVVRSRGEGDSVFAVFADAASAVAAACDLQRGLATEPWPQATPIRVRAALHTGTAQTDAANGTYNSAAVNRCARLRAIAHGGQTLLSRATYELVRDALPNGASLRDLGSHRLKDLQRPEQVFELRHPDLRGDFAPLKSLDALATNLPQQLSSFVGREAEMVQVRRLLGQTRLVTLTGTGGAGKTRLALQVAADLVDAAEYADGVWLAEFASVADGRLVAQSVASVLGMREEPGRTLLDTLVAWLTHRSLLLVLDNCEHLVDACAAFAETLLRACPRLRILVTSREAFNIPGETAWRVPSLSSPDPQRLPPAGADRVAALGSYESVRLFMERAKTAAPHFAMSERDAPALAQVCHRLDGIPLALELAAARTRVLSVEQIAARLNDRFRLLTGGARTALPRQQTLRATIDWSYDLLNEAERTLLRRLSVFAGGWTLEAAESVCAGDGVDESEVLDLLSRLTDKSLVNFAEQDGQARYRLPETVRQYACDRLCEKSEESAVRGRHCDWFAGYAERAGSAQAGTGSANQPWWNQLEAEYPNLRTALEWSTDARAHAAGATNGNSAETTSRLLKVLFWFWNYRGHVSDGRAIYAALLERVRPSGASPAMARLVREAGALAFRQADYTGARSLYEQALRLGREVNDERSIGDAQSSLGHVALVQGDFAAARAHYENALRLRQAQGSPGEVAGALCCLGHVARFVGDYDQARSYYQRAFAVYDAPGPTRSPSAASPLLNLGHVARLTGDFTLAQSHYAQSLCFFVRAGDSSGVAHGLEGCACLAADKLEAERAARLFGAADALREAIGVPVPPVDRAGYEGPRRSARVALGEERFAQIWAEGRALTPEQAIRHALADH